MFRAFGSSSCTRGQQGTGGQGDAAAGGRRQYEKVGRCDSSGRAERTLRWSRASAAPEFGARRRKVRTIGERLFVRASCTACSRLTDVWCPGRVFFFCPFRFCVSVTANVNVTVFHLLRRRTTEDGFVDDSLRSQPFRLLISFIEIARVRLGRRVRGVSREWDGQCWVTTQIQARQ